MRPATLLFAAILATVPAAAQDPQVSAPEHGATQDGANPAPAPELPVSLDRIRDALKRPETPILQGLNRQADFRVEIQEKLKLEAMLKRLDFRSGPTPAGGVYMYEQQRMLFNPTSRPLQQPYAAFSGSELITIAIENLIGRYLGRPIVKTLTDANYARKVRDARDDVAQAIEESCAAQPNRWDIRLCNQDAR